MHIQINYITDNDAAAGLLNSTYNTQITAVKKHKTQSTWIKIVRNELSAAINVVDKKKMYFEQLVQYVCKWRCSSST